MLSSTTSTMVGASLRPDSDSSELATRSFSGTRRSVEKTAAASVGANTAPSSRASVQSKSKSTRAVTAMRTMVTATPTVASEMPIGRTGRTSRQRVDRPPSARITTRAREADRPRQVGILELDAEPGLAHPDADEQVDDQGRQSNTDRQAHGQHGADEDEPAYEQEDIQVRNGHVRASSRMPNGARPGLRSGAVHTAGRARLHTKERCVGSPLRAGGGGGI